MFRYIWHILHGTFTQLRSLAMIFAHASCNVTAVTFTPVVDVVDDAGPVRDTIDTIDAAPGTEDAPALSCRQLRDTLGPISGVYWLRDDMSQPAFQAYCEQVVEGGGWAVLHNSVLRLDGTTTAFWNISYANRFATIGAPSISDNYYAGSMYRRGTSFLDVITDLDDKEAVAARVESQGINPQNMAFISPVLESGSSGVFASHFATGWSSPDFDGDSYAPDNCATYYSNVTQHYSSCWVYNLGSDADSPFLDGGVGPHVHRSILVELGLQPTADGGSYSRVKRITRYVRWE
jgi:hypothetical protein